MSRRVAMNLGTMRLLPTGSGLRPRTALLAPGVLEGVLAGCVVAKRLLATGVLAAGLLATSACATTSDAPAPAGAAGDPAAAPPLAVPPLAVKASDAPGYNIGDLTATLRDAVSRTSGVEAVDELSVKGELAACVELPCPTEMQDRFKRAEFVVTSAVSRVGDVFLARVDVARRLENLVRVNATGKDARRALEEAGWRAGATLREKLLAEGAPAAAPSSKQEADR